MGKLDQYGSWSPTITPFNNVSKIEHQKWDHIVSGVLLYRLHLNPQLTLSLKTLGNFRSSSCWTRFTYCYLWFLAIIAVAVYAADTYTAVVLLAYSRWPREIQPAIPFEVSRWLFAACIMFSWLLCAYQWFRAFNVMRKQQVACDYLDPLAAMLQSMRSWRRFLVFAELTKSRKGTDYVVLFTYFQFKGALRIIVAEGPRQAINGITLYAVMKSNMTSSNPTKDSGAAQFWINVRILAMQQHAQAAILFTMAFTFFIWVISGISLLFACLAWVLFLWHYVQNRDLSGWCKRKIEKRLFGIVEWTSGKELVRREDVRKPSHMVGSASTVLLDMRQPIDDEKTFQFVRFSALSQQPYSKIPIPRKPPRKSSGPLLRRPTLPVIEESPTIHDSAPSPPDRGNSNVSISKCSPGAFQQRKRPSLADIPTNVASTRIHKPSTHHRPAASKSSIVPSPLSIRRKPLPEQEHSNNQKFSEGANQHHGVHSHSSPSYNDRPAPSGAKHRTSNVIDTDRWSFQEHLPHPQGVHVYHKPVVQHRYAPPNNTKHLTVAPFASRKSSTRQTAVVGPKTFAAMGL